MGNLFSETKFKRSMLQQFALVVPAEHGAVSRFQKWIELNHKDLFHVYGKAKVDDVRPKVIAKPMPNLGGEKLAHSRDDAAAKFCKSREKCQVIVLRQSIQRSVGHKAPEFHVDVHWNPFPHDQVFMKSLLLHQGEFHVLHDALRVQKCFHGVDASSHAQHLCSRLEQRNDSGIYRLVGRLPNVLAVQGAEAALGNGGIFGTPARRLDKHWAATKLGFNDVVNGSCQACHHGLRFGWECGLVLGMIRSLKNPCVLFGQWQKLGPKRGRSKQLDPVLTVQVGGAKQEGINDAGHSSTRTEDRGCQTPDHLDTPLPDNHTRPVSQPFYRTGFRRRRCECDCTVSPVVCACCSRGAGAGAGGGGGGTAVMAVFAAVVVGVVCLNVSCTEGKSHEGNERLFVLCG
eukprot:m.41994 g.41994  ORF g.41994 m.41994 type:complete len:401 (+) comp11506_c0_seq5:337-1539(+)